MLWRQASEQGTRLKRLEWTGVDDSASHGCLAPIATGPNGLACALDADVSLGAS